MQIGKSAVVHAVFVTVNDAVVFADFDEFVDFCEDDFFQFQVVRLFIFHRFEAHAAKHFDSEFVHTGDRFVSKR